MIKLIGIIIVGHGEFAKGLISSVDVIAGEQKYLQGVEFRLDYSTEDLENNIKKKIETMKECSGLLFLTDIVGGTPFKTCVLLSQDIKNSKVLSGVNLPILLEAIMQKNTKDIEALKENIIKIGKEGIVSFDLKERK